MNSLSCVFIASEKFVVVVTRCEDQSCMLSLVSGAGRVTYQHLVHGKVNKVCLDLWSRVGRAHGDQNDMISL